MEVGGWEQAWDKTFSREKNETYFSFSVSHETLCGIGSVASLGLQFLDLDCSTNTSPTRFRIISGLPLILRPSDRFQNWVPYLDEEYCQSGIFCVNIGPKLGYLSGSEYMRGQDIGPGPVSYNTDFEKVIYGAGGAQATD